MPVFLKVAVTAVLVVAVSEVAKRSTFAGAVLASLPMTSLLAMIWLYRDTRDAGRGFAAQAHFVGEDLQHPSHPRVVVDHEQAFHDVSSAAGSSTRKVAP